METKSGINATVEETVAVHRDLYREYGAGHVFSIEGIGGRNIHDMHGNSKNVIDIFVAYGSDGECNCSKKNEKYNKKGVKVDF